MTDPDRISRALTALGPDGPDDAALNLGGALHDLRQTGRADPVVLATMDCVVGQIAQAQEALKAEGLMAESVEVPFVTSGNRQCLTFEQIEDSPWLADFVRRFPRCFEVDYEKSVYLFDPVVERLRDD